MAERRNCNAAQTFQVDLEVPALTTGKLGPPALGAVTGIKARISATKYGAAIAPAVENLAASERSGDAGRFSVDVSQSLMQTHVLALGADKSFYVIWSKANGFDMESFHYTVATGDQH